MNIKVYQFNSGEEKLVEKIVNDDYSNINHVILPPEEQLPEHFSNSNVYLIIVRGSLTLTANDEPSEIYQMGSIVNVPYNTKMLVQNKNDTFLEFFIVKAPNPVHYHSK